MVCYDIHKLDTEALFKGYVIRMPHVYILKGNAMFLTSQMEPLHSICKGYVMGFLCPKIKMVNNIVST